MVGKALRDYLMDLPPPILDGARQKPTEGLQRGWIWQAACTRASVVSWVQCSPCWLSLLTRLPALLLPGRVPEWAEIPVTQV